MKKLPKLKDLMIQIEDRPVRQGQPWEQQLAAVRQIMQSKRK